MLSKVLFINFILNDLYYLQRLSTGFIKVHNLNMDVKMDAILKKLDQLEVSNATMIKILSQQFDLGCKVDAVIRKQDELAKIMGEQNILLGHNLSNLSVAIGRFPIESEEELKAIDTDLVSEHRESLVSSMRRILCGDMSKNFERIMNSDLISKFNYDGSKDKKALKSFSNFVIPLVALRFKNLLLISAAALKD